MRRAETVGAGCDSLSPSHLAKPMFDRIATVCRLCCSVADNRRLLLR